MRTSPLLRYAALVLAALQLAAYGASTVLEGLTLARSNRVAQLQLAPDTGGSGVMHDRATCPACQLLDSAASPLEAPALQVLALLRSGVAAAPRVKVPAEAPGNLFYSRAPPPYAG
jgi:hypothetical protein